MKGWLIGVGVVLTVASSRGTEEYWPLQVGNRWVYEHVIGEDIVTLIERDGAVPSVITEQVISLRDTVELEVWGRVAVGATVYFSLSNGLKIRCDENGRIWQLDEDLSGEEVGEKLLVDFGNVDELVRIPDAVFWPRADAVNFHPSPVTRLIYEELHVAVPAGVFNELLFLMGFGDIAVGYGFLFAPGVGLVRSRRGGDTSHYEIYQLLEARIGTKQIGIPTAVKARSWGNIKSP